MANFLTSVRSSAAALEALQRSVAVGQNNVVNASTPGYVRQRMLLSALDFDPLNGLAGGVTTGGLMSSRDAFAEAAVRRELSLLGNAKQTATQLAWVEGAVDLNDAAGIPAALDRMYKAFQAWSIAPSSQSEKENVHAAATDLARAFNRTASALHATAADAKDQIVSTVETINTLAARIQTFNEARRKGQQQDAGVEAKVHTALEELSQLVNIQAMWQADGTVTVLAGGQAPLVVGDRQYHLSAAFFQTDTAPANADALPPATLRDASGADVTSLLTGGKLGALIQFRNETVTKYLGDSQDVGEVNRLARQVADRVNEILASGYPPPQQPYHLFVYGSSATSIAHAIRVNPTLAPALLNATEPTTNPPSVNGKALQLAALGRPTDSADMIDGLSYVAFFGKISATAGRALSEARQESESRELMAAQARIVRDSISGISLDEEAVLLVEFQRAYQATSRVVSVLDELSRITVNLGRA